MIEVLTNKNKEHNSLVQIKQGDTILYLTEIELVDLIDGLYKNRPDAFESIENQLKIEELQEECEEY